MKMKHLLLPPMRAAEIGECVCKYVDGISQNLQSMNLINHTLPQCFRSYRLWLKKKNHQVKQVDISEPTIISQSISMNRFYPIEALIFIQ